MAQVAQVEIEGGPEVWCTVLEGHPIHVGNQCILEMDGRPEFGKVLRIEDAAAVPEMETRGERPRVLHMATLQDQARASENSVMTRMALETVEKVVERLNLPLRVVRGHYNFDRSLFRLLFAADGNIDVRDLVRDLAGELHARIELRQIGVRDEAGMIGGIGPCGRRLCCCSWLTEFASVNVRMAKVQKLSLNPGAISGNCGRLKCCLRYEYDQYREMGRGLPYYGDDVECPCGRGRVLATNVMLQKVKIRLADNRIVQVDRSDVRPVMRAHRGHDDEDPGLERPEPGPAGDEGTDHLRDDDA